MTDHKTRNAQGSAALPMPQPVFGDVYAQRTAARPVATPAKPPPDPKVVPMWRLAEAEERIFQLQGRSETLEGQVNVLTEQVRELGVVVRDLGEALGEPMPSAELKAEPQEP